MPSLQKNRFYPYILLIILLQCTIHVTTAAPIKLSDPYDIEIDSFELSATTVDEITTSTQFQSTYTVNIAKLISPPQHYQIVYGYRRSNLLLDSAPGTLTIRTYGPSNGNTNTATSFQFKYYHYEQTTIGTVWINYMLIGKNLLDTLLVRSYYFMITSPTGPICNTFAGSMATPCVIKRPITLEHLNYKTYLSITGITFARNTSPITNLLKFDLTIAGLTLSSLIVNLQANFLQIDTLEFYFLAMDSQMFDLTNLTSNLIAEHVTTLSTATSTYSHFFPQIINEANYFMGINKYQGDAVLFTDFTLQIDLVTLRNQVSGWLSLYCKSLSIFVLTMYGYAPPCTLYRNCRQCYLRPNLFCTQCQTNFSPVLLASGNTDCQCQLPLQSVSGICDAIPFGCIIAQRLSDSSIKCHLCDPMKFLTLNSGINSCECYQHYVMDSNQVCQDFCGDGIIVQSQCDDGNLFDGDGCSSTCNLEPNFTCDTTVQPNKCKSALMLLYKVESILKDSKSNTAVIKLQLRNPSIYKFPVFEQHFNPVSSYIKLKIILPHHPYTEIPLNGLNLLSVNDKKQIELQFSFDYTIEDTEGQIELNYELTNYANYTETLDFPMVGDNLPLKFEDKLDTYRTISIGMLITIIFDVLFLFIGLISPKFIGLEALLSLQLTFFSQILIHDNKKFPVGFLFLENLQYSAGFNRIFDFTDYIPITYDSIKMNHIKRDKFVIENFNINFVILFFSFVFLTITFFLRSRNEKMVELNKETKETEERRLKKDDSKILKEIPVLKKINDCAYFLSNQVAFWVFLPLLASITAKIQIEDYTVTTDLKGSDFVLEIALSNLAAVLGFFLIFSIVLNNFRNIWLSHKTIRLQHERPEESTYKRILFMYLLVVGSLVFFANHVYFYHIYCSAIVLLLHIIFMIFIIVLNPYRYSLKVHFIGMVINNSIYLSELIVINLINYIDQVDHEISLLLGYTMLGLCSLSIIFTIIRLYYELRYGRELEDKMAEQRLQKQHQEKMRKQQETRRRRAQMESDAKKKLSDREKMKNRNIYLYENQIKEDQKKELAEWLQSRAILDQKTKDQRYFEKFAEKPLDWYQKNEPQKYRQKMEEIISHFRVDNERQLQRRGDENFHIIKSKLRQEVVFKKLKKMQDLKKHEKKMRLMPDYSMQVMKKGEQSYMHKAYDLKD